MNDKPAKPILCLDFDGVVHSYKSGWQGATVIPDPPVVGALAFIVAAMEHFTVAIYSSRSHQEGGIPAMVQWLGRWSVDPVHGMLPDFDHGAWGALLWPVVKPPALVTIDDRAITFDGTWPSIERLLGFLPWYKQAAGATGTYPMGVLNEDDQGGLKMVVSNDPKAGLVQVDFGKPVKWFALPPEDAIEMGKILIRRAGGKNVTVDF